MIRWMIMAALMFLLFCVVAINHLGQPAGTWLRGQYNEALKGMKSDDVGDLVIDPNKRAPDTKITYKGKVLIINGEAIETKDINFGISLNQVSSEEKIN